MHVVVATDKFRGTATAAEVGGAVVAAVEATGGTCDVVQVADGGEGFLDAMGGANRTTLVTGPLGDPVEAAWRISGGQTVVEMAEAVVRACVKARKANKTSSNVSPDPAVISWAWNVCLRSNYAEILSGNASTVPLVVTLQILIIA